MIKPVRRTQHTPAKRTPPAPPAQRRVRAHGRVQVRLLRFPPLQEKWLSGWAAVFLVALTLCAIQIWLLLRPFTDSVARPTAVVLAIEHSDPCAQRQAAIMRAIASYTRDQGEPPADLSVLGRPYLYVPAVEPLSDRPYEYTRQGDAVTLACPHPEQHVRPPQAALNR